MARTRRGLEPFLLEELRGALAPRAALRGAADEVSEEELNEVDMEVEEWEKQKNEEKHAELLRELDLPEGKEAEGAVEVVGAWQNLYWILRCSLVQSVWFRVASFRCESLEDLEIAVQRTPWEDYLDFNDLGRAEGFG